MDLSHSSPDRPTAQSRLNRVLGDHGVTPTSADFRLRHELLVNVSPAAAWNGLDRLTLADLPLARLFTAVRYLGLRPMSPDRPLLSAGPLPLVHSEPPAVAVAAGASQPWMRHPRRVLSTSLTAWSNFDDPGWVKLLLTFTVDDRGRPGSLLCSETLIWATSPTARRLFTPYWMAIRPFAALIRREILLSSARPARRQRAFDLDQVAGAPTDLD